ILRIQNRNKKDEERNRAKTLAYIKDNRDLIERGRHYSVLVTAAHLLLMNPDELDKEFDSDELPRTALKNCIDYISPRLPNLEEAARIKAKSKGCDLLIVLLASCLVSIREGNNLSHIDPRHLE